MVGRRRLPYCRTTRPHWLWKFGFSWEGLQFFLRASFSDSEQQARRVGRWVLPGGFRQANARPCRRERDQGRRAQFCKAHMVCSNRCLSGVATPWEWVHQISCCSVARDWNCMCGWLERGFWGVEWFSTVNHEFHRHVWIPILHTCHLPVVFHHLPWFKPHHPFGAQFWWKMCLGLIFYHNCTQPSSSIYITYGCWRLSCAGHLAQIEWSLLFDFNTWL